MQKLYHAFKYAAVEIDGKKTGYYHAKINSSNQ